MPLLAGIFIALHGLVHLWFVTLSQGWVEFQPEMGWSGSSWVLTGILGEGPTRMLAGLLYSLAAVGLVASGIGIAIRGSWAESLLLASAGLSTAVIVTFWDGEAGMFVEKGMLGVVTNLGVFAYVMLAN